MSAPKLHVKFPKPISCEWVRFEQNLPENSGPKAMKAAVYIDDLRRRWSPVTIDEYVTALDQYVHWLRRTNRVTLVPKIAPVFVWRSIDQGIVAHSSIFFEHAMVHLTAGLMKSVQRREFSTHFESANKSLGSLITYHGDTTSAYLKHLVEICHDLCKVREMTSGLGDQPIETDVDQCKRALNVLPNVPRDSQLYPYSEELREYLAIKYCGAYAAGAAEHERFDEAEVAMSVLGPDNPLYVKYSKMRTSVLQQKIPFETWIFSISDEEIIKNIPRVVTQAAPLFDFVDATPESYETTPGETQEHEKL